MITIRKNTFETNSSSTQSIVIPKNIECNEMRYISFSFDDFGWMNSCVNQTSYLYTAICNYYQGEERNSKLNKLKEILDNHNIEYKFQPIEIKTWQNGKFSHTYEQIGSVDHCDELYDFLEAVFNDENLLLRYLYSGIVYTGNDGVKSFEEDDIPDRLIAYYKPDPDNFDYFYKGN